MADKGPDDPPSISRLNIAARPRLLVLIGTILGVSWVLAWKFLLPISGSAQKASDPSIVITTFITLYGLFITGFGILGGLVAAKQPAREVLKFVAILFLIEATAVDLWRVYDSMNDLYRAAAYGLSSRALHDTIHDFFAYFVLNVFVVMVAVLAACLTPRSSEAKPTAWWQRISNWLLHYGTRNRPSANASQAGLPAKST